jgi:predicted RNase H-like nuclease (RuvC/YqgF family)
MNWIGKGVLQIPKAKQKKGKKELTYGDPIPEGMFSKERIKDLTKLGYIGEVVKAVKVETGDQSKKVKLLEKEVAELKAELEPKDERIKELEGEVEELKGQVEKLSAPNGGDK